jgi:parallel beta-helix repeat protein
MAVNLSPVGGVAAQFFTNTGAVLTGGKLYTYLAGTTTPAITYTSSNGATPQPNPIVLDAAGRVPSSGEIWLTDGISYKFILRDSNDVLIATYDNISGINSNFLAFTSQQQIITATANQTVFNLSISYQPATNSLSVFVDGVNQYGPGAQYAYTETDANTVTFVSGLHVGAQVKFTTTQQQGAGAVNASQVSYIPPFTGSVATNVEAKLSQYVSVIDFGADPTGSTVCTTQLQAAIDAVGAAGGGAIYVPAGTYITRQLLITDSNIEIYGDGEVSLFKRDPSWTGTNHGIFVLDNQAGDLENITISQIGIDFNNTDSFGFGIKLGPNPSLPVYNTNRNIRINNVRIKDSNPNLATTGDKWAIVFRGNLDNVWIDCCHSSDDMQLTASGSDAYRNITVSNCRVVNGRANGIALSAGRDNHLVEGVRILNNYIEVKALCIFLGPDAIYAPNTGGVWRDIIVSGNVCLTKPDGTSQGTWYGIYLNATDVSYSDVVVSNNTIYCKDAINGQIGVRLVDENAYSTTVSECTIQGNTMRGCRVGVDIANGSRVLIDGNVITNCTDGVNIQSVLQPSSVSDNVISGGSRGIRILNGEVLVTGNVCQGGANQTGTFTGRLTLAPALGETAKVYASDNKFIDGLGGASTNIYGVQCEGAGTIDLQVIDNDLRGNTAGVNNPPANARIQNNLGYVTNNGGQTAAIATGTTVNHGCASTPTIVQVTPLAGTPTDVTVTSINSTTFTINFGGGGSHAFAWEAKTTYYYQ